MSQKTDLLFSVVIPTRHRDDLLALCLDRLAPGVQTLASERYEVIVTDDGSQTTAKVMVEARYPWATWYKGPTKGPGANRNSGAGKASAPWLVFVDDDCIPGQGWLKAFSLAIESDKESPEPPEIYEGRTTCEAGLNSPFLHAPVNEVGGSLWSCNLVVRRDVFDSLDGFDDEFPFPHMEDVDLRERAWGVGIRTRFIPEAIVDHPPRLNNIGAKMAPMHESEFMFFYKAGFRTSFKMKQLRRIVSMGLRGYIRYRNHPEAWKLLESLYIEGTHILRYGGEWEKKYRARYENTQIPYPDDLAKRLFYRI